MFSKNCLRTSLSIFLSLQMAVLSACSNFLNEKKREPETIELSDSRFACLKALPEQMNLYLEGKVEDKDIRDGFECGKQALLYFKSKTRGSLDNAYTLNDIRNFFGKYFLKKNNVSPEFAAQLFKAKKVLLGGDEKSITKAEIQKMVDLLDTLKEQAVLLSPHFTTLVGRNEHAQWSDVDRAIEQLRATAWVLLREVNLMNSEYSFEDLKKLFNGLNEFINANQPFLLATQVESNMPLIEAVKKILVGEDTRFDNLADWEDSIKSGLLLYKEFLRYNYFLRDQKFQEPQSLDLLVVFLDDAIRLIDESLPIKRKGVIPFRLIDTLIDRLKSRGLVPKNLSAESIEQSYKKIVLRLLDPRRQGDARGLEGIEKTHLLAFKQEWKIYRLHQKFINDLKYDNQKTISRSDLVEALRWFKAEDYIKDILTKNSLEQENMLAAWKEGTRQWTTPWPVVFDSQGRLNITSQPANLKQSWASLTRWNLMRALGRAMTIGYGPKNISESSLSLWYEDFQKLGQELKAFDPRSENSGSRSFKEANFFTFSGNGNEIMEPQETFEFVSVLLAGGMSSANPIREDMVRQGCALPEVDVFGFPWMNEACFRQNLRARAAVYFGNLPGLVSQISKMSDAQWDEFYGNLMGSARISNPKGEKVEMADLRTAVMMLHYTEILMVVYDRDQNGTLNAEEVAMAAPRFSQFMKSVSPIGADFIVNDFFLYLVFKGHKPTIADYIVFQGQKGWGLGEVSRGQILKVFKVLKDEASKKK